MIEMEYFVVHKLHSEMHHKLIEMPKDASHSTPTLAFGAPWLKPHGGSYSTKRWKKEIPPQWTPTVVSPTLH